MQHAISLQDSGYMGSFGDGEEPADVLCLGGERVGMGLSERPLDFAHQGSGCLDDVTLRPRGWTQKAVRDDDEGEA